MLDVFEPDARPLAAARSQSTYAYETIRREIVAGVHAPGKKLKILDLAADLSVSPSAVREALSRLVPEQLVIARDQRGFVVTPMSIADLEDLTDLRCEIEAVALRRSLERGGIEWEASLLAASHRACATPPLLTGAIALNPDWLTAHAAFHTALVAACDSPRLLALHGKLYEQSERYRGISASADSTRKVHDEHREITALALNRDVDGAIASALDHMRVTTRLIVAAARADAAATISD